MTTPQRNQRNLNFRETDIRYILSRVQSGDCCSVVGVGSVGKSNLLRHLMLDDAQRYHMGQEEADTLMMVLIDPNNMLELVAAPARSAQAQRLGGLRNPHAPPL